MSRVFISHSSKDHDTALRLRAMLDDAHLKSWLAPYDIPPGMEYTEGIVHGINRSGVLVVLLSPDSLASSDVRTEVVLAQKRDLRVIPVVVSDTVDVDRLPHSWEYLIAMYQVVIDGDLADVVAECRTLLPARPATEPDAGPPAPVGDAQRPPRSGMFVGADRQRVLDGLLRTWGDVTSRRRPRVVVLTAEMGFGKTRLVQEMYARIAAGQPDPPFWPDTMLADEPEGEASRQLQERRKRITPPAFDPPADAEASFLWLGHCADEQVGGRIDLGLVTLGHQTAVHLGRAACRPGAATPAATMVAGALSGASLGRSPSDTQAALLDLLTHGSRPFRSVSAEEPVTLEAFWQAVGALWRGHDSSLPTVIIIEDGHAAGQATIDLVETLAGAADLPFLVVVCARGSQLSTSLPGGGERQTPLGRFLALDLPSVTTIELDRLGAADMRDLLREAIPDLDDAVTTAVVTKVDGNPYHLQALLVEMRRAHERQRLDARWVRERPSTLQDELRLQWRDLPDHVRRILSAMALLGTQFPERIGLRAIKPLYPAGPQPAVDTSVRTGWLRRLDADDTLRFLELVRWEVAVHSVDDELDPEDRERILAEGLAAVEQVVGPDGAWDPVLQELHLALAVTAAAEDRPFDRASALRSGLARALRLRLASDDLATLDSVRQCEQILVGHETDPELQALAVESALALKQALVNTLLQGGTRPETCAAATLAASRATAIAHERPDLCARAFASLSRAHRVRYDTTRLRLASEALAESERYLALAEPAPPEASAEVLHAAAMSASARGDHMQAAELTEARMAKLERAHGELDRRTVSALLNAGFYWTKVNARRAVTLKTDLLERRIRVWGDESAPGVATAQKELAFSLCTLGDRDRVTEAEGMARRAMDSLSRAKGVGSGDAALARGVWVFTACRLADDLELDGDHSAADGLLEQAEAEARRNLELLPPGSRPDLVLIRGRRLGSVLVRRGDATGVTVLEEQLARQRETVDIDRARGDADVIRPVAELAAAYARFERPDEAAALAAEYGLVRDERWPAYQPRGWRSTHQGLQKIGVL